MAKIVTKYVEKVWSSFVLLMTAVSFSVGLGNYWRFPWRAANYGGGTFLLLYIIWLILVAYPLTVAEYAIGKLGRGGQIHGPYNLAEKRKKVAVLGGLWMAYFCAFAIMFYYSSVTGWVFYYMFHAIIGTFFAPDFDPVALCNSVAFTPLGLVMGIIQVVIAIVVVAFGIKGIGRVARLMFPLLFFFTMGIAIFTLTIPGAEKGLEFYMVPRLEALGDPAVWMQSLSQVLWSVGPAMSFFLIAGAWMRRNDDITHISLGNILNDTAVAWLAGTAIIPLIFAISPNPFEDIKAAGATLSFIVLPQLFRRMGGIGGYLYGLFFFIAIWFAAITCVIAGLEIGIRPLKDLGMKTKYAAILGGIIIILCGIPPSLDPTWLEYYDTILGVIALPIGLTFICLITAYFTNPAKIRQGIMDMDIKPLIKLGKWWDYLIKALIVVPFIFIIWWLAYWEWIRGWDAGLHTYFTFPGIFILIINGIIIYFVASKVVDKLTKKAG